MLDINFIRQNPDIVKKAVTEKGVDFNVDVLLKTDQERRELIQQVDDLRRQRTEAAKDRNIEKGKKIKLQLDDLEESLNKAEHNFKELMLLVPNIPSPDSPVGLDSTANKVISKWGEIPNFHFPVKDHTELGKILGILDLEAGARASGFRGYYLKNEGAALYWAALNFALDTIKSHGFTQVVPPTLVKENVLTGSGHFPFGKDNVYQIANPDSIYLTGTSEPSLLALFADQVLDEKNLPIRICALTSCFRSEVGDYGKDVKGLYRVHEFTKVEQVVICQNNLEVSEKFFQEIQKISEGILQELGLPYQVVQTSTGDMGAGKYRMNDLETWMAGRGKFGETHSNSNLTDWQARRLNMRYRTRTGEIKYCHTLNNTVLASPRIFIPLLENFQQADSSVLIPKVLQKYTGFSKISVK